MAFQQVPFGAGWVITGSAEHAVKKEAKKCHCCGYEVTLKMSCHLHLVHSRN